MSLKAKGVLCGDPATLLARIAAELFPVHPGRLTGSIVLRRVRELCVDHARLVAELEVHRYAPPALCERTGRAQSAVDRAVRLIAEHEVLVDRWSAAERELAQRAETPASAKAVGEGA